jgi:hypothetical protein
MTDKQAREGYSIATSQGAIILTAQRHDISEYEVPVDPMDALQCDSCQ